MAYVWDGDGSRSISPDAIASHRHYEALAEELGSDAR